MRIAAASKAVGALRDFFSRRKVSMGSKYDVFLAIPINLLLWGCESWALRKDLLVKLERFVLRNVRRIIGINMNHMKKYKITAEQMRKRLNGMPSVQTLVDVRTAKFLGTLVCGNVNLPPRQLLIAFMPETRPVRHPIKCNKETMWQALKRMLDHVDRVHIDNMGSLNDCYLDAAKPRKHIGFDVKVMI